MLWDYMNSRIAPEIYQRVNLSRKLRWSSGDDITFSSFELAYSGDANPADVLASASNDDANRESAQFALQQKIGGGGKAENLLYIIQADGEDEVCKVGYSYQPYQRLGEMQVSSWRELKIVALFCPVKADMAKVERSLHQKARRKGIKIRGEWLAMTPLQATEFIMENVCRSGCYICGTDVYFDNIGARLAGLRKEQQALLTRRDDAVADLLSSRSKAA